MTVELLVFDETSICRRPLQVLHIVRSVCFVWFH